MGMAVAGLREECDAALLWLVHTQRADGSWPTKVLGDSVLDESTDTNFCTYLAAALWHHFLRFEDVSFVRRVWPTVARAVDRVLGWQQPSGVIGWVAAGDDVSGEALLTGCSSIARSLACAVRLGDVVGADTALVASALGRLRAALRVDSLFAEKSRFSMDWYYPVLAGAYSVAAGRARLLARWGRFVEPGVGIRCVADQPWVTVAETHELVLACSMVGWGDRGASLMRDVGFLRGTHGQYVTGYVLGDHAVWPEEETTWTAGAVLLAYDAVTWTTKAAQWLVD